MPHTFGRHKDYVKLAKLRAHILWYINLWAGLGASGPHNHGSSAQGAQFWRCIQI